MKKKTGDMGNLKCRLLLFNSTLIKDFGFSNVEHVFIDVWSFPLLSGGKYREMAGLKRDT